VFSCVLAVVCGEGVTSVLLGLQHLQSDLERGASVKSRPFTPVLACHLCDDTDVRGAITVVDDLNFLVVGGGCPAKHSAGYRFSVCRFHVCVF